MISLWILWVIIAALLLVIELLTGTVAFLCLSIGCVAGMIPAVADLSIEWQVVAFAVCTLLCFIFLRPAILKSSLQKRGKEVQTNMDAIIGRTGKVTHPVTRDADDRGRVRIDGDNWLAYTSEQETPIPVGTQVVVEAYDSIVIKVRRKGEDGDMRHET